MRPELVHAGQFAHASGPSPESSGGLALVAAGLAVGAALLAWFLLTMRARATGASRANQILLGVAALSAGAGLVHAAVTPEHFDEHAAYGLFFVVAAVAQVAWPVWLMRRQSRAALAFGVIGTAGIVAIWIVSRTFGLPVGPEAFEPEKVGATDGLATLYEAGVLVGGTLLLRGRPEVGRARLVTGSLWNPVFASIVALVTFAVLAATPR